VDEIPAAAVDERAIVMNCRDGRREDERKLCRGVCSMAIIIVHRNTSLYINKNEVKLRLGTNMQVYSRNITLTYSQVTLSYTCSHPHPSPALKG
jgi:hypothetical protein